MANKSGNLTRQQNKMAGNNAWWKKNGKMKESQDSPIEDSVSEGFTCELLDTDLPYYFSKGYAGIVVYVRLLSGTLPAITSNVLIDESADLRGRPAKGSFFPIPAQLTLASGRNYHVALLARLPTLAEMRLYLRSARMPPPNLDMAAIPLVLAGLPLHFRAISGRLESSGAEKYSEPDLQRLAIDLWIAAEQVRREGYQRRFALLGPGRLGKPVTKEEVLEALDDEFDGMRTAAAYALGTVADQLPIAPFLQAIRDMRPINCGWCLAAAFVFGAHPDEVSPEILVELYEGVERAAGRQLGRAHECVLIQVEALRAMGHFGARAPVDLLAQVLTETRAVYDIRERCAAAEALGELGALAPVEALIAGMENPQPEVAVAAARALAQHPAQISDEVRKRARLMSDMDAARRTIYGRR
jgi:HEAT repeat protein